MKKLLVMVAFLFIFVQVANAQEVYVSNSADWQDVYSTILFANIEGGKGYFLVSTRHSTLLINQLNKNSDYLIVSSSANPYVVGYESVLESRGFKQVEEIRTRAVNLELASRLSQDVTSFIVIDDSYGYNAISVAPYATSTKSYVLFANSRNINQIMNFLDSRQVDEVILYGQVDREVKDSIAEYDPEIINEGDRFLNNQLIVDKYQDYHIQKDGEPKKQAILTNGEFIEQEIMSGVEPVVFIGRTNVPDQVREYIQASDIDIGILIGNELIGSATFIRRQLGISVFVKFAQSARAPTATISPVEDLDRFYLPRYILNILIYSVRYNTLTNSIEVTYQNTVDLSAYLKGTITIRDGDTTQVVGDEDAVFIDKSEFKTLIYSQKADGSPLDAISGDATAEVFTIFGESPLSLEYTLRETVDIESVDIRDSSQIEIVDVRYDRRSGTFLIEIRNIGDVDVFTDVEIIDLLINDELVTLGSDEVIFIPKGQSKVLEVEAEMTDEDLESNPRITIRAYYGERERSLIKVIEGEYEYGFTGLGYVTGDVLKDLGQNAILYAPVVIILILLILILGMKKKCPHCGEVNNLRSKTCVSCSGDI